MKQLGLSEIVMEKLQENLSATMEKLKSTGEKNGENDEKKEDEAEEEEEMVDLTQPIVEDVMGVEQIVHKRNMSYQHRDSIDDDFSFLEQE